MKYCPACGTPNQDSAKFCVACGGQLSDLTVSSNTSQVAVEQTKVQESVYFKGEGTLIIRKTMQNGTTAKATSSVLGSVSSLAFGRDKKSTMKAEGELIVTNKAIYCAGNVYAFDRLISLTRDGRKAVAIELEYDGSRGGGNISIEAELRMNSKESCDELFRGLEHARTSHLQI